MKSKKLAVRPEALEGRTAIFFYSFAEYAEIWSSRLGFNSGLGTRNEKLSICELSASAVRVFGPTNSSLVRVRIFVPSRLFK